MLRFREKLYDIAGYVTKESSSARELADGIYADLYGMVAKDGKRVSKLSSYTGRGSLEGWLRTVISQEFINRYRRQRRLVSLDEENEEGVQFAAKENNAVPPVDSRLESATDEALAALSAEERFMLAAYYLDDRTLAEIARMLSVHESTISRKLDKLAKSLHKQILAGLGRRGLDRRQAEEALQIDVRDVQLNVRTRLTQERQIQPFSRKKTTGAEEGPV
jgi:RNA polymerase sigma-70 factor (ECF subfamily)